MYIKTETQDAVEIITIDRPQALNALNPEVLEELKAAFEAVDQETVRCIILTGAGEKHLNRDLGALDVVVALGIVTLSPDAERDLLGGELVEMEQAGGV